MKLEVVQPPGVGQPRILIAEDDPTFRAFLREALSDTGYRVDYAPDGTRARELLARGTYDVLVADVNLPGVSGMQLFAESRHGPSVPQVIIITGYPAVADAVSAVKQGAFDYLVKPVRLQLFLAKVTAAVAACRERQAKAVSETLAQQENVWREEFTVVRSLGKGGVGALFLVEKGGAFYALKTLKFAADPLSDADTVARFRREGQVIAQLDHPGIVKVVEANFGTGNRLPYILMEYVEGDSLKTIIEKGAMDLAQKVDCIRQIAVALGAVHAKEILHRDIKPGNVIVATRNGQVKITDFGIARLHDSTLTVSDEVLGTPAYMAPESFNPGGGNDPRSDLFSLGVLSYHLLTGHMPFNGETVAELIGAITSQTPKPLCEWVPDLPVKLVQIVVRMLAKDPAARYPTAADIATELEQLLTPA